VDARWTLSELVAEVANRITALPAPKNGQVRALPDERTVRYYGTIGLIDRPGAMRGRTALYGDKHVAQVVAIKRLQAMGRSLSEIQTLWPTLDDATLSRMSGVTLTGSSAAVPLPARDEFWKRTPTGVSTTTPNEEPMPTMPMLSSESSFPDAGPPVMGVIALSSAPASVSIDDVELTITLAPNVVLTVALPDDSVAISPADVRALRAAAAPLLAALAARRLTNHEQGE
jgi:DNA-binding transcriptional MerR regulator